MTGEKTIICCGKSECMWFDILSIIFLFISIRLDILQFDVHLLHIIIDSWFPFKSCALETFRHRVHFYGVVTSACYYHWSVFVLFYFLTSVVIHFDPIIWTPMELQFQVANYSPEPEDKNLFRLSMLTSRKTVIISSYGLVFIPGGSQFQHNDSFYFI